MSERGDDANEGGAPRELRTLQVSCFVLCAGALILLFDLWPWLLLALWTASIVAPLAAGLRRRVGGRGRAAGLITIGLLMALFVPVGAGIGVLIPDVLDLAQRAMSAQSGPDTLIELVSKNKGSGEAEGKPGEEAEGKPGEEAEGKPGEEAEGDPPAQHTKAEPPAQPKPTDLLREKPERIVDMVKQHGQQALTIGGVVARTLASFALGVFVYFVSTYAALVHGDDAYRWVRARLPLSGRSTDRLRDAYVETGHGLLYSVGLTALLQGGLAAVAYVSLGVPRALALGLATIITSLIPAIGPFLVWGPVAAGLYLADHPIKAGILVAVGVLVVAPADNVLRPLLARRGQLALHPFVVFFAMVGAMSLIGGWGLIVGPLVFRMAREVVDMLHERATPAPAR